MPYIANHDILHSVGLSTILPPQEVLHDPLQLQNLAADLILRFLSLLLVMVFVQCVLSGMIQTLFKAMKPIITSELLQINLVVGRIICV